MQKHAFSAGLVGAPARLRPVVDLVPGYGGTALANDKAAGHQSGTTAASIESQQLDSASIVQALQLHIILTGLPALVDRFGCGVAHDLRHMTIGELAGLYSYLKTLKEVA